LPTGQDCGGAGRQHHREEHPEGRRGVQEAAAGRQDPAQGGPGPQRFGVPAFEGERIVRIDEKPKQPASNYAVIGIYMYDATVST